MVFFKKILFVFRFTDPRSTPVSQAIYFMLISSLRPNPIDAPARDRPEDLPVCQWHSMRLQASSYIFSLRRSCQVQVYYEYNRGMLGSLPLFTLSDLLSPVLKFLYSTAMLIRLRDQQQCQSLICSRMPPSSHVAFF